MNFIEDAIKTKSDKFYAEKVSKSELEFIVNSFIYFGNRLDNVKKNLFYNKDNKEDLLQHISLEGIDKEIDIDIIHAILGVATEGVEMVEALAKVIFNNQTIDLDNLYEESGDVKWYLAILANALGKDWSDDENMVIKKLKARFPNKFTTDDANIRDLKKEREVIESN